VSYETDWFQIKEARLQLRPYNNVPIEVVTASMASPSGPRAAGRLGTGLMSMSATAAPALAAAGTNWDIACEIAQRHGNTMNRRDWRMIGLVHCAETRKQALQDVQFGLEQWVKYFEDVAVIPMVPRERRNDAAAHLMESGMAVIGTPDDCIQQIERLWASSKGGFGCYLITDHNWAPFPAKLKSYEMVARYVIPHFQNQNQQREDSNRWVQERQRDFKASHEKATAEQIERYRAELETRATRS